MINTNHINIKSSLFEEEIKKVIAKYSIEQIIETGTNTGVGSTTILSNMNIPVITIECSVSNYNQARLNLFNKTNVTILNGFSLKKEEMINFIVNDKKDHPANIMIDTLDPVPFYLTEINFDVPEDLLFPLINNSSKQLIFLDSAGGIGYIEYLKVMSLQKDLLKNKVLVLDDIYHVKHYRSVLDLEQKGHKVIKYDRFCIVKL
jgi:hypothetical protein